MVPTHPPWVTWGSNESYLPAAFYDLTSTSSISAFKHWIERYQPITAGIGSNLLMCLAAGYKCKWSNNDARTCARGSSRPIDHDGVGVNVEYGCMGVLSNSTGCGKCT